MSARSFHRSLQTLRFHMRHYPGESLHDANGQHVPVLALHGFMDHGITFTPLQQKLGWEIEAWDARGFGQSEWIAPQGYYHFFDYVRDLYLWVERVCEETSCEQVLLLGHSMGGMIASLYAGVYPERVYGLINMEGWLVNEPPVVEQGQRLRRWLDTTGQREQLTPFPRYSQREEALARMRKHDPRLTQAQVELLASDILVQDENGYFWRHDPLHRTRAPYGFRLDQTVPCWEGIVCPHLLLYGSDSPILKLPDLAERLQAFGVGSARVSYQQISDAGHNLHLHQAEAVAAEIRAWQQSCFAAAQRSS